MNLSITDPSTKDMIHFLLTDYYNGKVTVRQADSTGVFLEEFETFNAAMIWMLGCCTFMVETLGWEYIDYQRGDVSTDCAAKLGEMWAIRVLEEGDEELW